MEKQPFEDVLYSLLTTVIFQGHVVFRGVKGEKGCNVMEM